MSDPVIRPGHYDGDMDPLDVMASLGIDHAFARGCAIKYLMRAERKGNVGEDLEKALFYVAYERFGRAGAERAIRAARGESEPPPPVLLPGPEESEPYPSAEPFSSAPEFEEPPLPLSPAPSSGDASLSVGLEDAPHLEDTEPLEDTEALAGAAGSGEAEERGDRPEGSAGAEETAGPGGGHSTPSQTTDALVTPRQAAAALGLSACSISGACREGRMAYVRKEVVRGRATYLLRMEEAKRWMDSRDPSRVRGGQKSHGARPKGSQAGKGRGKAGAEEVTAAKGEGAAKREGAAVAKAGAFRSGIGPAYAAGQYMIYAAVASRAIHLVGPDVSFLWIVEMGDGEVRAVTQEPAPERVAMGLYREEDRWLYQTGTGPRVLCRRQPDAHAEKYVESLQSSLSAPVRPAGRAVR